MKQSKNWAKVGVLVAVLNLLILRHFVSSSSIYVGRHAAATISEHGGSEGEISEVNTCEDSDRKLCRKILTLYGNEACTNTHDKSLQNAVQKVCQSTCGFCIKDCQDQSRDLCEEYKTYCRKEGALGNLLADICPKTCNNCQLRPSKSENNWVIING